MTDYQDVTTRLKAMGHPARLQILDMLRGGELCVCHIEAALGRRQAYVSQQLMALRDAELVDSRRDGLRVFYWLVDESVAAVLDVLLGPVDEDAHQCVAGCPCPQCAESECSTIERAAR